jgi:hypothetical protein
MKWSEIPQYFPVRCVLIEALKSETRGKERAVPFMCLL